MGEDNIKTEFKETGCNVVEWNHLAQNRDQWRTVRCYKCGIHFTHRQIGTHFKSVLLYLDSE
jgi:hypothetical protein